MNQIIFKELLCQHKLHNGQNIQAICVNRKCERQRKMCIRCSNYHGDRGHKTNDIANEKEINSLIQEFKIIQDENQLLFEQDCIKEMNGLDNKVNILLNKLRKFDQIQKDSQQNKETILKDCSLQEYLQKQSASNIGLYQYFDEIKSKILKYQTINRQIELEKINPELEQSCNEFNKKLSFLNQQQMARVKRQLNEINYEPIPQLIQYSHKTKQNNRKCELKLKHICMIGFIITLLAIFFNFNNQYKEEYQYLSQKIYGYQEKSYILCNQYHGYYLKRGIFNNYVSHYDQAIELFQKELKLHPKSAFTLLNIAQSYQKLGSYNSAIQIYQNVIQLDPDSVISYLSQGNCFYQQKKFKQAIEMYTNALLIDPYHIDAMNNKGNYIFEEGMALFQLQQYQYALQQFRKAKEINNYFIKAIYNKGVTENILGLYDDAANTFDQLLALAPDDEDITYQKALNLYYQQKYEESNIFLDQILDIDSLNQKTINLFKLKLYDQAVVVNDIVLKKDSANKQAIKINFKKVLKGEYEDN